MATARLRGRKIKSSFPDGDFAFLDGQKRYCGWTFAYVMACGAGCRTGERPERE